MPSSPPTWLYTRSLHDALPICEAAAHSGGVHQSAGATEARRNRRHDCDVRVGAAGFARSGVGAADAIERAKNFQVERGGKSETPGGGTAGKERSGNVALLRRGAATVAQD